MSLGGAVVGPGEEAVVVQGWLLSLLGTTDPATPHTWFDALGEGGQIVDALQQRSWGAFDGQVVDRFGLRWLIG